MERFLSRLCITFGFSWQIDKEFSSFVKSSFCFGRTIENTFKMLSIVTLFDVLA